MSIDTVGDFLTAIRNSLMISRRTVTVRFSKVRLGIAQVLKEEGFIRDFKKEDGDKPSLMIQLKYVNNESVIHEITRVSTPGRRRYERLKNMTPVVGGLGVSIVTTNVGIITDREARKRSVGGEVICHVW